jgi:hypothetical protein
MNFNKEKAGAVRGDATKLEIFLSACEAEAGGTAMTAGMLESLTEFYS